MHPDQRELAQVVIKQNLFLPTIWAVAAGAILSLLTIMRVIQLMTAVTVELQVLTFSRPCVAFIAIDLGMFALQRKFRLRVVIGCLFPSCGLMAIMALFAKPATVRCVRLMAGDTGF